MSSCLWGRIWVQVSSSCWSAAQPPIWSPASLLSLFNPLQPAIKVIFLGCQSEHAISLFMTHQGLFMMPRKTAYGRQDGTCSGPALCLGSHRLPFPLSSGFAKPVSHGTRLNLHGAGLPAPLCAPAPPHSDPGTPVLTPPPPELIKRPTAPQPCLS